jgi:ATP-binding cassette, subfamily B, multidrug efflux pump
MKLIFSYLMKHKKYFILNLIAIFGVAIAELGITLVISNIIDKALPNNNGFAGDYDLMIKLGSLLIVVALIGAIGNVITNFASVRTSTLILVDIRNDVFKKVQTFSSEEISQFGISSLITRTTSDVFQILNFVSTFYRVAFMSPAIIIVSLFLVAKNIPSLLPATLISIPIVIFGIFIVIKLSKPLSERQQVNLDKLNKVTRENLTGVRVVRAFRKNKYEAERFDEVSERYTSTSLKLFKIMTSTEPIFFFILNLIVVITLYFAGFEANRPGTSLTIGRITEFFDYQFLIMFSILSFSMLFVLYPRTMVSARRISAVLNTDISIKNKENALTYVEKKGTLEFKNVSFKFVDSDLPVLDNINFTAKAGETVSFIGSTGSGKSTLINLVPRLTDVTSGEILLDGVNIKDFDLNYLRSKIGFIPQKAILFNGTIESNIRYGKKDATKEEIINAAKVAQAHEFIVNKELGYNDPISEMGANLSGGQRQRVSIARAIVKNPDIYIFDDSFSALDYKTASNLNQALKEVSKNAITLIVAQRISQIMNSDKIIVLNKGKIVGIGKHKELMKDCQIYQEIAKSQLSEEELQ